MNRKDGKLVEKVTAVFADPADFSPSVAAHAPVINVNGIPMPRVSFTLLLAAVVTGIALARAGRRPLDIYVVDTEG